MSNSREKYFNNYTVRLSIVILFCAIFITYLFIGRPAQVQVNEKEPIAFVGHGGIFDQNGQEIAPTLKFIKYAQEWYLADLNKKVSAAQRTQFLKLKQGIALNLALDEQSQLVFNSSLLDWLIEKADIQERARLQGKNNVLKMLLKKKLTNNPDIKAPRSTENFQVNLKLVERLNKSTQLKISKNINSSDLTATGGGIPGKDIFSDSVLSNLRKDQAPGLFWNASFKKPDGGLSAGTVSHREEAPTLTGNGGALYRQECTDADVPVPPNFGTGTPWVSRGTIPQNELFIAAGLQAEVLTYTSTTPAGMCIALPRYDTSNVVQLDGIICLGQTGNVCFWDNEKNGSTYTFVRGASGDVLNNFGGGTELLGNVGGVCSDCHMGENPYVIHGTALESLSGLGLPTFAPQWHEPIVRTGDAMTWPENPGPMNSPVSCRSCHGMFAAPGFAGRLPHISTESQGYCGAVLRSSVGARPLKDTMGNIVQNPIPTMPQGNPGGLVCTPNLNPGDPGFIRACTGTMTASCNADSTLLPADPVYLKCEPQLAALLDWCGEAPDGDGSSRGDPHVTTVDGINYDFQSAGEFVYLRNGPEMEIQVRQTPVSSAGGIPANSYTGLASCVSVITAVSARIGKQRISFQPRGQTHELYIDGKPRKFSKRGINLGNGGFILQIPGNGIEIYFPDKSRLIVTTNWWSSQNLSYMNVDVVDTQAREGVMGAITKSSWLPVLPDGMPMGPKPASLAQRYTDLNVKFADAWRVTPMTSLFEYAPGTSTATFTDRSWPPNKPPCIAPGSSAPPAQPMDPKKAVEYCKAIFDKKMQAQCVFDLTVTGELGFARTYLATQSVLP